MEVSSMLGWTLGLLCGASIFVLYPFFSSRVDSQLGKSTEKRIAQQDNVRSYQDQQKQHKQQLSLGEIDEQQYERLLADAQRLLLSNADVSTPSESPFKSAGGMWLAPVLVVFLSVSTFFIYHQLGAFADQNIADLIQQQSLDSNDTEAAKKHNDNLIAAVEKRVEDQTDNVYYWMMLAQSALGDQDIARANNYFAQALKVKPKDSYLLGQYAESLFLLDQSRFTERVTLAVDKAFMADANNYTVLGLKGIEAFSNNELHQAISYWRRAQQNLDSNSVVFQGLQLGIDRAVLMLSAAPDKPALFSVTVDLSIDASVIFEKDQLVFVAVLHSEGPPMPLAAIKLPASKLPDRVTLSDRNVLVPGQSLSSANIIKVVARLSSTGSATPQSGDWEAVSESLVLTQEGVQTTLSINRRRQ
jgi:cytochrome c-type biogenesis protein CcmH